MTQLFFDGAEKTYGFILNGQPYTFEHEEDVGTVESEALSLLHGLKTAVEFGFTTLEITGDSQVVLNMVMGVAKPRGSKLRSIFSEIWGYLEYLDNFKINWVPRRLNPADKISRKNPA